MKKSHIVFLIVLISIFLNVVNLKSLSLIDWDEGGFALQAKWLASRGLEGKPFNFQTPPLYQFIIAVFFRIFGYNDWILPFISILCSAATLYIIFLLGKELHSETTGLLASVLFVSTEYFLFFSKSGLSDATFLLFFTASVYFFYRAINTNKWILYLCCSIFTLLACYTKYTGPILFLVYLFIGLRISKKLNRYWFLFTIVFPLLLLLPYFFIFIKVVSISGIAQRHGKLVGINHLKFLFYLIRFAPLIFVTAILHRIKSNSDYFVLTIILIFFIACGFYHPYFRLALPLIPLLSIFSAKFLYQFKKLRYYMLGIVFFGNVAIGFNTITYTSNIPPTISRQVDSLCRANRIDYVIALTPPNIVFYLNGSILPPTSSLNTYLIKKGILKNREFISKEKNPLFGQEIVLLVYASIFEDIEKRVNLLKPKVSFVDSVEFIDAPVYYKDLFNPLRNKKQFYKIYLFEIANIDSISIENLWEIGLMPGATVLRK
ncbi:MAG: ArnT family glycosyltransferase [bacterium]